MGLDKIYIEASSPYVLIIGAANSGCRQFWMSLIVDVANSGCFQLWMPQAVDLKEAENNGDRALAGRRTLIAAQKKSVLRGGLGGIKFPRMMWLGYMTGLEREG